MVLVLQLLGGVIVSVLSGIVLHLWRSASLLRDWVIALQVRVEEMEKRHDKLESALASRLDRLEAKLDRLTEKLTNA